MAVMSEIERDSWLEWRRQGIGASDAAAICGLDPWRTPMVVWLEKTGQIPPADESEQMFWGSRLEHVITDVFEERTGLYVRNRQQWCEHAEHPWMRCTLDGLVYDGPTLENALGVYEGKTTSQLRHSLDWSDGVPDHYALQVQHQLAVTEQDHAWVSCLVGGQRLRIYELERDQEVIDELIQIEAAFWYRVQNGTPPAEIDGTEPTTRAIRAAYAEPELPSVDLDSDVLDLIRQRQNAKAVIREQEKIAAEAENRLAVLLGTAEAGRVDGREVIRWPRVEIKQLDQAALKAHYAGLVERFTKTTAYRRFHIPTDWEAIPKEAKFRPLALVNPS